MEEVGNSNKGQRSRWPKVSKTLNFQCVTPSKDGLPHPVINQRSMGSRHKGYVLPEWRLPNNDKGKPQFLGVVTYPYESRYYKIGKPLVAREWVFNSCL